MRGAGEDAQAWYEARRRTLMRELQDLGVSLLYIANLFAISVDAVQIEIAAEMVPVTAPWYGGEVP